jgi:hypothetical protein
MNIDKQIPKYRDIIDEKKMIELDKNMAIIESHFPNANVHMDWFAQKLDEVFSERPSIIIKIQQGGGCLCFRNEKCEKKFMLVQNDGTGIKNFQVLKAVYDSGFEPRCDHRFLEGFFKDTECQFTPQYGR